MIIRKPYAFLIKNFRRLHIVLLLLGLFVLYKTIDTTSFVNEFMRLGTYDFYADPITNHISYFMRLFIILIIIGSTSLLFLLKYKNKPWKTYLIPIISYIALFFILGMIRSFFNAYTEAVDAADLRLSRDLLFMSLFAQIPALGIFGMRFFGLDVKKFNFNSDLEFLDLSEEDREEIELSLDVDINTFKRMWRRFLRNANYFYKEHKFICRALVAIFVVVFVYRSYVSIFITHKTYKQGELYKADGYSFIINKAYFTNLDAAGNVISKNSNFVIVEVTVKNSGEARILNTSNFHLKAGTKSYSTTETTYANEFSDLGKSYSKVKKLQRDEELTFILIYKVDKNIRKGKFVMYYQEKEGIYKLRKIKLMITDISKIEKPVSLSLGEFFDVNITGEEESICIDSAYLADEVSYKYNKCTNSICTLIDKKYISSDEYKILVLDFGTETFESKNIIDFLTKYGKIKYKDSKGKDKVLDIVFAVDGKYYGKTVYLKVPKNLEKAENISLDLIVRTKEYLYSLM